MRITPGSGPDRSMVYVSETAKNLAPHKMRVPALQVSEKDLEDFDISRGSSVPELDRKMRTVAERFRIIS